MKSDNICKFISSSYSEKLSVSSFILESEAEKMERTVILTEHRAILVIQGDGMFNIDGHSIPFTSGTLVFGFKHESFTVVHGNECKYMYITFSGSRADELFRRFDINIRNRSFDGFGSLIPLWSESLSRASQNTIDLASESILLYTFSRITGSLKEQNSLISKIIEISEDQFTDSDLSLASLANILSYNPKYISTLFKDKMGVGYSEYLKTLRIKYAVSLFDHGIESVKNVALLSGFKDPLYFSTVFKKNIGLSPKEYKNSLLENKKNNK